MHMVGEVMAELYEYVVPRLRRVLCIGILLHTRIGVQRNACVCEMFDEIAK
jgi:hypothetical protein